MDFAVPVDQRVEIKGSEKRDKYVDLVKEQWKLCNMKVTVIPIITGAIGTVVRELERG